MSSSYDPNTEGSDAKLATEASAAGINSITNTVGMHPTTNEKSPPIVQTDNRHGSCSQPGCTAEHSGKPHE